MIAHQLPDWIPATVQRLLDIFSLTGWDVKLLTRDRAPDGHNDADGVTKFDVTYMNATIFFDERLEPDADGLETVIHETLHLVLGEMRELVAEQMIAMAADEIEKKRREDLYDYLEERAITVLARGLARYPDFLAQTVQANAPFCDESVSKAQIIEKLTGNSGSG